MLDVGGLSRSPSLFLWIRVGAVVLFEAGLCY